MESSPVFQRIHPRLANLALAAVSLIVGALFWFAFNAEPGAMGRLYPADLINYYYPVAELVSSRLAAGGIPLWDPGLCSGMPFFATLQPGVLYPGNWLGVWIPVEMALPLRMFLEIVLTWNLPCNYFSWEGPFVGEPS